MEQFCKNPECASLLAQLTTLNDGENDHEIHKIAKDLIQKGEVYHDQYALCMGLYYSSICDYHSEKYQECLGKTQRMLELSKTLDYVFMEIKAYNILALLALQQRDYNRSLDYLLKAFYIADEYHDGFHVPNLLNNIGSIFLDTGLKDHALDYFQQAYNYYQVMEEKDQNNISAIISNLIEVELLRGNFKEVRKWIFCFEVDCNLEDPGVLERYKMNILLLTIYEHQKEDIKESLHALLELVQDETNYKYSFHNFLDVLRISIEHGLEEEASQLIKHLETAVEDTSVMNAQMLLKKLAIDFCVRFHRSDQLEIELKRYYECSEKSNNQMNQQLVESLQTKIELEHTKREQMSLMKKNEELIARNELENFTMVLNKTAFVKYVKEELAKRCSDEYAALFIIDIDYFKNVNDTYGHLVGDALIKEVAEILKKHVRGSDLIGRIGGDEFIIFMRNIYSMEFIEERADTILSSIRNANIAQSFQNKLSASIGIRCIQHQEVYESMFAKADRALYEAKFDGRNKYIIYSEHAGNDLSIGLYVKEEDSSISVSIDYMLLKVFDMLNSRGDVMKTLENCLSFIAEAMGVDCTYLLHFDPHDMKYSTLYLYEPKDDGVVFEIKHYTNISDTHFFRCFDEEGIFYIDDTSKCEPELSESYRKKGTVAALQQLLYLDGKLIGMLSFDMRTEKRMWLSRELSAISRLGKMFASFIGSDENLTMQVQPHGYRDSLTHLDTLDHFMNEIIPLIHHNERHDLAAIRFDIRKFKIINDDYGYHKGNQLLIAIARLLRTFLQADERCTRCYADSFLLLVHYQKDYIEHLNDYLHYQLEREFGTRFTSRIFFCFGVYEITDSEELPLKIIDKASIALRECKRHYARLYQEFDQELMKRMNAEKEIEYHMHNGLDKEEFKIYLQPKVEVVKERLNSCEALIRWDSKEMGFLYPDSFIPLFEKNGFIIEIDFYVLEKICKEMALKKKQHQPILVTSINISRITLESEGFCERLREIKETYDIDPAMLELEITESAMMEKPQEILTILNEIKNIGFRISMDDFGSGFSSLNLLRKLPIDTLKIDREFLNEIASYPKSKIIITKVIEMAKELNIWVICEGVESKEQLDFLKECECDEIQGFYFYRPMKEDEFNEILQAMHRKKANVDKL